MPPRRPPEPFRFGVALLAVPAGDAPSHRAGFEKRLASCDGGVEIAFDEESIADLRALAHRAGFSPWPDGLARGGS